ncbi:polysaccharide deacetylase family protein [Jiella mangrovi]|uniref:Chitooligosaccharide deacetylase n=1 Tax=Jiella mangrovi TaxID=2821407 RepID=A0ABS4BMN3_9HYPH|nr:polysaccharide deacetylase family protein [Jiella mangrovi]MBP0617996.1 polysaccharide deacetylase family protein [Jiella mangrovi]
MRLSPTPVVISETAALGYTPADNGTAFPFFESFHPAVGSTLSGRTIAVARYSDIALEPKEVVLTFDDGPMPGKTHKILKALGDYGVSATFLMVGQMAKAYPQIARDVAEAGHTIGTHTYRHPNLRTMSDAAAMAEIRKGEISVAEALAPIGLKPAPFFCFPYLADTATLRHRLAGEGIVTIDVDIDSKDYFRDGPAAVRDRTLRALEKHGRGIILMHDIQNRTAAMLPGFLAELEKRGYKVVRLVPADQAPQVAGL